MPAISIIVPIYNVERYLQKCIESIIGQTFKDIEIILVDDGSPDNCGNICDRYSNIDTRIRVIHKKNGGLVSARKAGLQISRGKYVGFVDGDDWIEPDMYMYMYNMMESHNVSVVETGIIYTYENYQNLVEPFFKEGKYSCVEFKKNIIPQMLYTGYFFQTGVSAAVWNKLFYKNEMLYRYNQLEDGCDLMEDGASVYPYILNNPNIYVGSKCFYHYRVNPYSITKNVEKKLDAIKGNLKIIRNAIIGCQQKDRECLLQQFYYMQMYNYMWVAPWIFDKKYVLQAFGGIREDAKVILYGAGSVGINLYKYLKNGTDINIIDWVDKKYIELRNHLSVNSPIEADYKDADYVIITALKYTAKESIKKDLLNLGVKEDKILWVDEEYINNPQKLLQYI